MKQETKYNIQGCLAIFGGILIHFTLGHFYTIANMVPYIMGYTKARVQKDVNDGLTIWLSALALCVQGICMPIGGMIANKIGFRIVVGVSCIFESVGVLLTYFTIQKTFFGVIVTYALLNGVGLGLGYSVVIAVATSWFPARRGLVSGLIVGGFGLGALIFTPIQTAYINPDNVKVDNVTREFTDPVLLDRVPNVFLLLGGLLLGIQLVGFILLRPRPTTTEKPEDQELDEQKTPLSAQAEVSNCAQQMEKTGSKTNLESTKEQPDPIREDNLVPSQVLRHRDFYRLWIVMFCDIIPITIITSAYKYFGQTYISDDRALSAVATVSALFNSGGRMMWGAIVDRISFKIPMCFMLAMWSFILFTFPHLKYLEENTLKVFYGIWICLLFVCISGVFSIMPTATGSLFGPANMAVNYGLVYSAVSVGTLVCALVSTFVSSKGAYVAQFTTCGFISLIAFCVTLSIEDKRMNRKYNICLSCKGRCSC
ncbi:Oxalate:formate antiporter [Clonorchis sinensis]|uniref:Oxalate:formate antiporter n=1 Tax=Clonorchis sinensis TaxID=79923 RepID=A0A8T1M2Q6_CLOSI|nr:Oxalate:formate antiporter [Clonorchis sinensis]